MRGISYMSGKLCSLPNHDHGTFYLLHNLCGQTPEYTFPGIGFIQTQDQQIHVMGSLFNGMGHMIIKHNVHDKSSPCLIRDQAFPQAFDATLLML